MRLEDLVPMNYIFLPNSLYPTSDNQVEPDAEIRHNRPGSSQHEHVAAGVCAQGRKQDAHVRRGEQGGLPGTPGGLQVNRIDLHGEGHLRASPATKAANNREIASTKF